MRTKTLQFTSGFRVALGNNKSQAAEMVILPGDREGGPGNRHSRSDQWLFVLSGQGQATVNDKSHSLKAGTLLLIEQGDRHEIRNTGQSALKTLNFYVPPAY
jgi:mannose-6-phosphate isomerase-like protein (cupin superfamily)